MSRGLDENLEGRLSKEFDFLLRFPASPDWVLTLQSLWPLPESEVCAESVPAVSMSAPAGGAGFGIAANGEITRLFALESESLLSLCSLG